MGDALFPISKVYRSYQSLFYLSADGQLYCSGVNSSGQLGLGPTEPIVFEPILNTNLEDEIAFVSSGCAATHCFVVTVKGTVFGFGNNSFGQLGIPKTSKVPLSQNTLNGTVLGNNFLYILYSNLHGNDMKSLHQNGRCGAA